MSVPVQILGVHVEQRSGAPIVLLGELGDDGRVLPIFVGPAEANAIIVGLRGVRPPRPNTHDLLLATLGVLDANLVGVDVTELRDGTFIAELEVERSGDSYRISARPSDSIALAVRLDLPIFVAADVLDAAGVGVERGEDQPVDEEQVEEIIERFHDFIADADPSDFALEDEGDDDDEGDD